MIMWMELCRLKILKPKTGQAAYDNQGTLELMLSFLSRCFLESIARRKLPLLCENGHMDRPPIKLLNAHVGLEIAASFQKVNAISDFRSKRMFAGLFNFQTVISRDIIKAIWSFMGFYPQYDHEVAVHQPLWHSRYMLHHLMVKAAACAVPLGVFFLYENLIRCKGRKNARSYMKLKPISFGMWFYPERWSLGYLFSS